MCQCNSDAIDSPTQLMEQVCTEKLCVVDEPTNGTAIFPVWMRIGNQEESRVGEFEVRPEQDPAVKLAEFLEQVAAVFRHDAPCCVPDARQEGSTA